MSRNFLRSCLLSVGGVSVPGGGPTDLRITFSIKQAHVQAPAMAAFRVYNCSPSTAAALKAAEGQPVQFSAGYQDNVGIVFSGDVKQTISGHETAVDSYVDIFAADGDRAYNQARVTKTLSSGWTPQDKLQAAIDAMAPFGVTLGVNTLDLSQPKYPRGIPLIGMARDIVRQVVLSKGGIWSVQQGQLKATDKSLSGGSNGGALDLNPSTGLVGWPRQTQDGIYVRSLLNPALQPLAQIKLDPASILAAERDNNPLSQSAPQTNQNLDQQALAAGTYTIYAIDRTGDTRGQDWYDDSMCIGVGGSIPQGPADKGYSVPYS